METDWGGNGDLIKLKTESQHRSFFSILDEKEGEKCHSAALRF